jgi:hypothetical protein
MVGAGALGLAYLSAPGEEVEKPQQKAEVVLGVDDPVQTDFKISGNYGDISDISTILQFPGTVQEIKVGQDLYGTPCRWIRIRGNNCWYRTYNMTEDWCMAPPRK